MARIASLLTCVFAVPELKNHFVGDYTTRAPFRAITARDGQSV